MSVSTYPSLLPHGPSLRPTGTVFLPYDRHLQPTPVSCHAILRVSSMPLAPGRSEHAPFNPAASFVFDAPARIFSV